jgi:hypothetical protein
MKIILLVTCCLVACSNNEPPTFIASPTLLQPCKGVIHHDSNKLIDVVDDIIENDNNHIICQEKLKQWQLMYNNYIKEYNNVK